MKRSPLKIVLLGLGISGLLVAVGVVFMNPPVCPAYFTQQEIDATNCVIGANIGLGLMVMLAAGTMLVAVVMALVAALPEQIRNKYFKFL